MDAEQLPDEEMTVPAIETTTQLIGSTWKRKRTRSEGMGALASKRWHRGKLRNLLGQRHIHNSPLHLVQVV